MILLLCFCLLTIGAIRVLPNIGCGNDSTNFYDRFALWVFIYTMASSALTKDYAATLLSAWMFLLTLYSFVETM
jgi:hypothetical protein